jgi:hypothetical protein
MNSISQADPNGSYFPLPQNGSAYADQFWSANYSTLCSFVINEARLVWTRFAAFLIVHGFFFKYFTDEMGKPPAGASSHVGLLIGAAGLALQQFKGDALEGLDACVLETMFDSGPDLSIGQRFNKVMPGSC